MSEELNMEALENDAQGTAVETKAKKEKKEVTAEDLAAISAAVVKINEFGVSENFAKVLPLVEVWHDTEASAPIKAEVIEAFGGSEKFKDYIGAEFEAELAVIAGIAKGVSVLNNIKSFYKRRGEGKASGSRKKVATIQINISGDAYTIEQEYYESLAGKSNDEKKALLLEHPGTKKVEAIELL